MNSLVRTLHRSGWARGLTVWRSFERTKLYDALAALPLILWYGLSINRLVPAIGTKLADTPAAAMDLRFAVELLMQVAAIGVVLLALVFLLFRPPAVAKSKGFVPRITAFLGTFLIVAVVWLPRQPMGVTLSLVSLFLMLGGVGFTAFSLAYLGRSFSLMPEARRLVTGGPYAYVRHPLYLGEVASTAGLMLQFLSPLAVMIVANQITFQLLRMRNEEQVLAAQFPEYEAYRKRTARLIPGLY